MPALTGIAWKICRFPWKFCGKNATDIFPGFPWILKSVVIERSKFHKKHGNYEPIKCISHKSTEKVKNIESVKPKFGSFHGVTENVETVENKEYNLWKF